jgi:hypothetical protein
MIATSVSWTNAGDKTRSLQFSKPMISHSSASERAWAVGQCQDTLDVK